MTFRILFCMLLLPLGSAHAQGTPALQPGDPAAAVPAVPYRSVFADLSTGVEAGREDWKKANAEVGRFTRGHVDILKWEQQQTPPASPATPAEAAKPAAPSSHTR